MASLTRPPRLAGLDNGQGPSSISDWLSIYKFLIGLWRQASESITAGEVEAIVGGHPPTTLPGGAAFGTAATLAYSGPWGSRPTPNAALALQDAARGQVPGNLAGFLLAHLSPPLPPSSTSQVNPNPYGVVVQGTHNDRISVGTGTISGNALTWVSGPLFNANWIGFAMAINGALVAVTAWASSTSLTLSGTPPTGSVGWEFMLYPANSVPIGTAFMETDRKVVYRVGTSAGTCNLSHSTVTWVSGPLFSPYWGGLPIVINSITYLVSFSTSTTLTLTTDSGLVTSALGWAVLNSSWFYETGTEQTTVADLIARLSLFGVVDDGYQLDVFDYQHQVVYNGSGNAWAWRGNDQSKTLAPSADGTAPNGGFWQFCDGTTVAVFDIITGVPQLVNVAAPDLRSDTFLRGGSFTGTPDVTTPPTFSNSLSFVGTAHTLTGTISTPTFTGASVTPTGSVSSAIFSGNSATLTGNVAAPTFTGVALGTHTHDSPVGTINATTGAITGDFGNSSTSHTQNATFTIAASAGSFAPIKTSAASAGTPSGTNSAPALTMDPYTPSGTIGGQSIAINPFTPSGTVSTPTLTMASYTPAGTIGGTGAISAPVVGAGAPRSFALLWYMRR